MKIKNVYSEKSFIGIAVKDGSKVEIIDAKFKNIMKYALMTFKKRIYDYPILEAKNITYDNSDKLFMSQKGSSLIINKEKKTEQDFINTQYMQSEKYRYEIKFVSNNNNINYFYNWINNQTLFKDPILKELLILFTSMMIIIHQLMTILLEYPIEKNIG